MAEVIPLPEQGGAPLRPPEPITDAHDTSAFACTHEMLNVWLRRNALKNERGNTSRTYVVAQGARVVAYYALAAGGVIRGTLPKVLRRGTPDQIPVIVLGRLATDRAYERRGIGSGMLQEAIKRSLKASAEIGVRALLVHAIDESAVGFYFKYGFISSPTGNRTLLLPIETARQSLIA